MSFFGRRPPPPPPPAHSSPFGVNRRIPNPVPVPPGQWAFVFGIIPVAGVQWDYPLVQADCKYQLVDVYLSAALTHIFKSHSTSQSHVSYVFPLPPDSSVHEFTAYIDDRVVKGVIKEKGEAKAAFNQAVANNQQAALLEQQNEEVFKMSLGNVLPGQTIKVQISFVSLVSHEGVNDTLRLTFPTSIAPRYGTPPGNGGISNQIAPGSSFEFQVSAQVGGNITSISSPSHPIASQLGSSGPEPGDNFDPSTAFISLSSATFLESDIVLVIGCKDLDRQRCVVESSADGQTVTDAYALTFVPRFKLPPVPQQEYIFLVDRSGSMGGGKIEALRSALQIMLKSLPNKGSSFNIISFGSSHSKLWPQAVPYTAENVQAASAHVDTMRADYGGTEMQAALLAAFSSRSGSIPPPASIFVLTDGEAWNLDAVRETIRNAATTASTASFLRVFCMGIGNQVSKAMCEAIAKAGNGSAVYVTEGEKPDRKLVNLLRAAQLPPVTDLEIDWGIPEPQEDPKMSQDEDGDDFVDLGVKKQNPNLTLFDESYDSSKDTHAVEVGASPAGFCQHPPVGLMPALLPGSRYSFYAIVDRGPHSKKGRSEVVRLKGSVLGQPISLEIPVASMDSIKSQAGLSTRLIHLIAARSIVRGLDEQGNKPQVLSMGLQYGLVTSQTSFVAIDDAGILPTGPALATYAAPQAQQGLFGSRPGAMRMMSAAHSPSPGAPAPSFAFSGFKTGGSGPPPSGGAVSFAGAPAAKKAAVPQAAAKFGGGRAAQPFGFAPSSASFGADPMFGSTPAAPASVPSAPTVAAYGAAMLSSAGYGVRSSFRTMDRLAQEEESVPLHSPPVDRRMGASLRKKRQPDEAVPTLAARSSGDGADIESSVEALARIQAFDGSFTPSAALFRLVAGQDTPPAQPSSLQAVSLDDTSKEALWCSILVAAYLAANFVDEEDVWSIFTEKTFAWAQDLLNNAGLDDDNAEALIEELRATASQIVAKK